MKLNITFVDEVSTDKNKYIINIDGVNYSATINSDRNISVNGTPLTASILNQIVYAINVALAYQPPVESVNGLYGHVIITPEAIGLGSVDNTSDLAKPLSTAMKNALNEKEDKTNLKALAYKDSLSKSDVGLGNVDNTADSVKNVKSAINATNDKNGTAITSYVKNVTKDTNGNVKIEKGDGTTTSIPHRVVQHNINCYSQECELLFSIINNDNTDYTSNSVEDFIGNMMNGMPSGYLPASGGGFAQNVADGDIINIIGIYLKDSDDQVYIRTMDSNGSFQDTHISEFDFEYFVDKRNIIL